MKMSGKSETNFVAVKKDADESSSSEKDYATSCGIGSCRPDWLQIFANPKFFVINFSIVAILQGAYFTYLVGAISTLEKRFAFESKISGFILIADNLSQMFASPIVGYLGSKYNRSHLIAIGELIVAFSCFISALPYFIYGPGLHLLTNTKVVSNFTQYEVCQSDDQNFDCQDGDHSTVILAVVILWFASFANGLGYTAYYTIGLPYIDDNVQKKNSPLYISAAATLRLCGPSLGFLLCSICLRVYEDPFFDPHIERTDPRWVGAWWIGFLIIGILTLAFALPMFLFPKQFKGASVQITSQLDQQSDSDQASETEIPTIKEAKAALKRLARNPILIFHVVGGMFRVIGYLGYYVFQPKYIEMQYRQSASGASFFTGSTSIFAMAIGIMGGGILIRRFRPRARPLVVYMFIVELIANMSIFIAIFLGCPAPNFVDTSMVGGRMILDSPDMCNYGCDCSTRVYQPTCSSDGISTYFSPCYAGCKTIDRTTNPITFGQCDCIKDVFNGASGTAQTGYCPMDCNMFPFYIIILTFGSVIASTARTGDTLIALRCVDPKDKSFAMGIIGSIFAIFAYIPYPLLFGAITDATCVVWEESCGKTGNCWLYDIDKFRYYLHGASFAFMTIGSIFDIGIILMSDRLQNLYDDEDGNGNDVKNTKLLLKANDEEDQESAIIKQKSLVI